MNERDLIIRTKQFALRIIKLVAHLGRMPNQAARAIANQLVRCGTSVGANCRAACKARSRAEFVAKLGIVEEEADESCFWLELISESGILPGQKVKPLLEEASELVAIIAASKRTARSSGSAAMKSQIANCKSQIRTTEITS